MLTLLTAKSEGEINKFFDKIQTIKNLTNWVRQKWVITSLNNCVSQFDSNIWKLSNNTKVVKAAHASSNHKISNKSIKKSTKTRKNSEVININSEDSSESDYKESSNINRLEYQEQLLVIKK
ncbi:hypothetical protein C2G38_2167263 [Gigaspora rosea]|uniref:Uncharacterized protein n=1 Tax=Gigaspora rosea TaxID=44941 RepID=A0A397VSN1_9GLOM|nr:hypothetical protein C2G38_2167263 [Gigaspora rosea]